MGRHSLRARNALHRGAYSEESSPLRYLHTMVRVTDLDASLRFWRDLLGLEEVRRMENEAGRFTLVLDRKSVV